MLTVPLHSKQLFKKNRDVNMKQRCPSFSEWKVQYPFRSFCRRCCRLVKEKRARFYIFRRCIVMLVCWNEYSDL
ncbi:hypothetical protein K2173_004195 [Erythroxylum novogranatense]|uniref:Uncharacterized protein n=1 Tax=Erythroxylum novogranatense TaxID=1862640 RepID=A0AAV8SYW2_9ROSI|nr:hypothetical protein K2173_004195 [Erythroxylum novogranatense]